MYLQPDSGEISQKNTLGQSNMHSTCYCVNMLLRECLQSSMIARVFLASRRSTITRWDSSIIPTDEPAFLTILSRFHHAYNKYIAAFPPQHTYIKQIACNNTLIKHVQHLNGNVHQVGSLLFPKNS